MQSLEDGKYLLMKKNYCYIVLRKKTGCFPQLDHRVSALAIMVPFTLSVFFSNTKKNLSVILNFRKLCLTGHVQRFPFTMGSKW